MKNLTEQEKKQQAIDELKKILIDHAKKALKISKYYQYYTPKKHSTTIKRMFRIMTFVIEAKLILRQIELLQFKFKSGGIAHTGKEMIISKNSQIIPTPNIN